MTTVTTTIPDDKLGQVRRNAELAWKSLSIYAAGAVSVTVSALLALGPQWVTAFISVHPVLAPALPFVGFGFVILGKLAQWHIVTGSDRQAAVGAWLDVVASRLLPGQPLAVPPEVARSLRLAPSVSLVSPAAPEPVDPAPGPVQVVQAQLQAMQQPVDLIAELRTRHPDWTDAQVVTAVQAALDRLTGTAPPKPQAPAAQPSAIVIPPFLQAQPVPVP